MDRLKPLHPGLDAYTLRFEDALLDEIRESYRQELSHFVDDPAQQHLFHGGVSYRVPAGQVAPEYFVFSYDDYPLLWFSNNTARTFEIYRRFYDSLGIDADLRQLVDIENHPVMYCGFLVLGDRAPAPLWHYDYLPGAHALTLIAPLFELAPEHGQLLYQWPLDQHHVYVYTPGEAVVFGENFLHTTQPYAPTARKRVLVSMTFGTDKLLHWPQLQKAVKAQSHYYVLPCGHVVGTCHCLLKQRYHSMVNLWKGKG